jgi:predicted Fe-Mo cluster-binding NifX family protein
MEKIAITASEGSLKAQVDPRFGRAAYVILVDPETLEYEALANQKSRQAAQGAGIQAAALVACYHPAALLTGYCGPKAFHTLSAAGVPVYLGVTGSVREAVKQYLTGNLTIAQSSNVQSHWGER